MNKRERVMAAIQGKPVDRIPVLFTAHFPKELALGDEGVASHLHFFDVVSPDIQKIMNGYLVPNMGPIRNPVDWRCFHRLTDEHAFVQKQLAFCERILEKADPLAYQMGTIHGVVASSIHPVEKEYGYDGVRRLLCEHLRQEPQVVRDAMRRVADCLCMLAQGYIRLGMQSVFYASLGGERELFTDEEFERYVEPLDKQVLNATLEAGGQNLLHMCKDNLSLNRYSRYEGLYVMANWSVHGNNPPLCEGRRLFPSTALVGGFSNTGGSLFSGDSKKIAEDIQSIIAQTGTERFILGADCSLPAGFPFEHLNTAMHCLET